MLHLFFHGTHLKCSKTHQNTPERIKNAPEHLKDKQETLVKKRAKTHWNGLKNAHARKASRSPNYGVNESSKKKGFFFPCCSIAGYIFI